MTQADQSAAALKNIQYEPAQGEKGKNGKHQQQFHGGLNTINFSGSRPLPQEKPGTKGDAVFRNPQRPTVSADFL
jgi:hypothetical protein